MGLHPGEQITDHLRLARLLGRGAMGSVWVAEHLGLQSEVAVKFMAATMADDPVSVQRFRQEAKAAAEIRSPHVVQVLDHGQTPDGQLYIAMELLDGEPLDRRVRRDGPLFPLEALGVVTQCCKALAKAHERGILHRDIKPANVFLLGGEELFVKLLDFGVAKFSGEEAMEMTAAGNMVGTPAFMSPEQLFHGKDVDHRGDLWSLAVVTYYALTGARPFEGNTLGELCVAIKEASFRPASEHRPDLPAEVDAWFSRAFHRDVEQRFGDAKELAQGLEAALGSTQSTPSGVSASVQTFPGTAVPSGPSATTEPVRSNRPWLVAAAVVALSAGGGLAAFVSTSSEQGETAADGPAHPPEPAAPAAAPAEPEPPADEPAADAVEGETEATAAGGGQAAAPAADGSGDGAPAGREGGNAPSPPPAGDETGLDERSKRAADTLGI